VLLDDDDDDPNPAPRACTDGRSSLACRACTFAFAAELSKCPICLTEREAAAVPKASTDAENPRRPRIPSTSRSCSSREARSRPPDGNADVHVGLRLMVAPAKWERVDGDDFGASASVSPEVHTNWLAIVEKRSLWSDHPCQRHPHTRPTHPTLPPTHPHARTQTHHLTGNREARNTPLHAAARLRGRVHVWSWWCAGPTRNSVRQLAASRGTHQPTLPIRSSSVGMRQRPRAGVAVPHIERW
jgi:hypothetical protein